jgi:hypothetical protein
MMLNGVSRTMADIVSYERFVEIRQRRERVLAELTKEPVECGTRTDEAAAVAQRRLPSSLTSRAVVTADPAKPLLQTD